MNQLDSQRMAGQLMHQGVLPTRNASEADIILLNSCSVRDKAEQKVYSRLGQYRRLKRDRQLYIGLCGCVAQQVGEEALKRVPELDFVLGAARVDDLTQVLARCDSGERVVATGFPEGREYRFDSISREAEYKGMVTIIEGCNKMCTFCIVPFTRGPERNRPRSEILAEVRHLVDFGFLEIELLGQTVNHWCEPGGEQDFADLLDDVATIPGVRRLRFVTSYPRDFTEPMVEQFGIHENICPYLHLPVQSGSDRILKSMGRGYTAADYRRLVKRLRRTRPDIALSTDIIVGFPGETEEDYQRTLELVEELEFASIYAFCYSPRPGTAALKLPDPVEPALAQVRLQQLFELQDSIQRRLNAALVGREFDVLVTGWGKKAGTQVGRTSCHRVVHFDAQPQLGAPRRAGQMGQMAQVRIQRALPHSLIGRRLDGPTLPA